MRGWNNSRSTTTAARPSGGTAPPAAADVAPRTDHWVVIAGDGFVREHDPGGVSDESGIALARSPVVLVGPGVAFVRSGRVAVDDVGYPDLEVEVRSLSNPPAAVAEKRTAYDRADVPPLRSPDPRRTVRVRAADGADRLVIGTGGRDGGDVMPGFKVPGPRFIDRSRAGRSHAVFTGRRRRNGTRS